MLVETESLLSVAETAERLGVARWTIYRWIEAGKIQAIRLGGVLYVPREEVERLQNG